MNRRTRRLRALLLLGAALLSAGTGVVLFATDALRRRRPRHHRRALRPARPEPDPGRVVVVGIDDPTINTKGYTFPFRRKFHADAIRNLTKAGAKVIAYDVQFTQPSTRPADDERLIEAVRAADGRVVLATTAVDPGGKTQIFGGGDVLEYSRASPGVLLVREGRRRHPAPVALQRERPRRRSRSPPPRSSAAARSPPRRPTASGSTSRAGRRRSSTSASSTCSAATSTPRTCAARSSSSAPPRPRCRTSARRRRRTSGRWPGPRSTPTR